MRQMTRVLIALCALALVVSLCGCGGSGGSAGPSVGTAGKPPPPPPPPPVPAGTLVGNGLYTINTNGTGKTLLVAGGFDPCWSPDGQQVCFRLNNRLYTVPHSGGTPTQFTTGAEPGLPGGNTDYLPAWSPDGQRIAFKRYWVEGGYNRHAIVVKEWPSGPARLLTSGGPGFRDEYPTWSPDGQYVLFNRFQGGSRLFCVAADGGGQPYLVKADDSSVSGTSDWYRDAASGENWIVYSSSSSSTELCRLQVDAAGHALGSPIALPNGGYSSYYRFPSWSPDGKFVAFNNEETTKKGPVTTTYILDVATSALYKVGDLGDVDWSPVP